MYAHKNGVIVICDNLQLTCCYCCLPNDVVPLHFNFSSYISWRLTTFINQWCNSVTLDVDFIYYLFMNASKCCDLVHHQQKYLWYCDSKLYILFHLVSVSVYKLFRDFVRKKFELNRARFSKQNTSSWSGNILVRIYTSLLCFWNQHIQI